VILRETIDQLTVNLHLRKLFPVPPTIDFSPESPLCAVCGQNLKVLKTKRREVATLVAGQFIAHEIKCSCPRCGLIVGSQQLACLVSSGGKFGYDVLVYVGESTFLRCRNAKEIVGELKQRGILISHSEVGTLARKFVVYLSIAHKRVRKNTRGFLNAHGGYVLHLDGTCEGGSPHLISALDGITEIVLENVKMPSENSAQLIPFLSRIRSCYGDPVAVVSDMGKAIVAAVKQVFTAIPHLLCHFHFLRDLGKDLFGAENEILRKRLSKHGAHALLRRRARSLRKLIDNMPQLVDRFADLVDGEQIPEDLPVEYIPTVATYTLIVWALEGKRQGQGCGFPFDQPYLVFYQRLQRLDAILRELNQTSVTAPSKEKRVYTKIIHDLLSLRRDSVLRKAASKMEEKLKVFNNLRAAMRITTSENKRGLNDNGELVNIKTIEQEVQKFTDRLCKDSYFSKDPDYQKMIEQMRKYWKMLFCDPIVVKTEAGNRVIQPQRTNNILERFFRDMARRNRKKSGINSMERTITAMLADTPLVKNLQNQQYLSILLDGKDSLEQLFTEIDVREVRDHINKLRNDSQTTSAQTKRIIQMLDPPESLVGLLQHQLHNSHDTAVPATPNVGARIGSHSAHHTAPLCPHVPEAICTINPTAKSNRLLVS